MTQADPLAQSESFVQTVDPHLPHESHTWLPPIVEWHALNPVVELALQPLYVEGRAYEDELKACRPMPQVVALVERAEEVRVDAASLALLTRELALVTTEDATRAAEVEMEDTERALVLPRSPEVGLLTRELAPVLVGLAALDMAALLVDMLDALLEPLKAADTSELRLDTSAEFVMVLTGTNVELMTDTLEMTDAETALLEDEAVLLLGDTKLRVADEDDAAGVVVLTAAAAFVEVLERLSEFGI